MPDPNTGAAAPAQAAENMNADASAQANQQAAEGQQSAGQQQPAQTVDLRALHEAREQIKGLREELQTYKAAHQVTQYAQPVQQQQAFQDVGAQLEKMWEEDPRKAMQAEITMALQWYDSSNAEVDQQEEVASKRYADFDKYRGQIRKYLRSVPVSERIKPGMVESAFHFVKGMDVDNIIKAREEELLAKYRAGEMASGVTTAGASGTSAGTGVKYTVDELKAAQAMNMPIEQYLKYKR